jgi:hypothetical protein
MVGGKLAEMNKSDPPARDIAVKSLIMKARACSSGCVDIAFLDDDSAANIAPGRTADPRSGYHMTEARGGFIVNGG